MSNRVSDVEAVLDNSSSTPAELVTALTTIQDDCNALLRDVRASIQLRVALHNRVMPRVVALLSPDLDMPDSVHVAACGAIDKFWRTTEAKPSCRRPLCDAGVAALLVGMLRCAEEGRRRPIVERAAVQSLMWITGDECDAAIARAGGLPLLRDFARRNPGDGECAFVLKSLAARGLRDDSQ